MLWLLLLLLLLTLWCRVLLWLLLLPPSTLPMWGVQRRAANGWLLLIRTDVERERERE